MGIQHQEEENSLEIGIKAIGVCQPQSSSLLVNKCVMKGLESKIK